MPEMPVVVAHDQLASFLWEVGPTSGPHPISHTDIFTWQANTFVSLNAWEARTLRHLSVEYVSECARATDPECPSPTEPVMTEAKRDEVARRVRAMLRSYMKPTE